MDVETIFYFALSAAPMLLAFLAGSRCRSDLARRVLRFGSIGFAVLLSAAVLFLTSCDGNVLYGLGNCGPWGLDPSDGLTAATVLVFVAYVTLGPALLAIALVAELRTRRRLSEQPDPDSDRTDKPD